ncbi:hypothetical protein [Pseudactinotalea terrae]|uniref:hypothetical protein n=1 Tax=Pseudactinotalea terrae TaxID=1743262 RepID=UPI0012E315DC|nr:hypothetical protein [Pseudactinotalea terrae]
MDIRLASKIVEVGPSPAPDWATVTQMELHYDYFLGDFTFRVGETDFSTTGWEWVPQLDFALALRTIAAALTPGGGEETFEFTENGDVIRFRRVGDRVEISASYVNDTASVPHDELLAAAEAFLDKLALELLDAHPGLGQNEYFRKAVGRAYP